MKSSNYLKTLIPTFLFVDFADDACAYDIYIYIYIMCLIIKKNQETNRNINVQVKSKTYFQLKFMPTIYPHGYVTHVIYYSLHR